ncbi:hypothetical protein VTL71DRAFT_10821 [Oculimacula yallundae]|uniref:C2H2-type domain-containing protein n=1 Tax=Oculimacula yallundae TaxID=86028 RepID=A0ABR4CUH4_9HELO
MANLYDRQPEDDNTMYLYRNCNHEHIGPIGDLPTVPAESFQQRYILEPRLCPSCTYCAHYYQSDRWLHYGCKHAFLPGPYPNLEPSRDGEFPADLRVQDLSEDGPEPNVNVLHPRFCLPCLNSRQATLRALKEEDVVVLGIEEGGVDVRGWTRAEQLAYARGCRDGRVLAEETDFRWGNEGIMEIVLKEPNPYESVGDAVTTDLEDPLMNALANQLLSVDLRGEFNSVDALANALSIANVDDPQYPVIRTLHWRYQEGKTQGLYAQWRLENGYLSLIDDYLRVGGMEMVLNIPIKP